MIRSATKVQIFYFKIFKLELQNSFKILLQTKYQPFLDINIQFF
jgi:hypothetical protein